MKFMNSFALCTLVGACGGGGGAETPDTPTGDPNATVQTSLYASSYAGVTETVRFETLDGVSRAAALQRAALLRRGRM